MSTLAVKKVKLGDNADTSKNFLIEVPAVADGTLTIKRENGTSVLSIDATGKAVIPGVVGTVAQVGGIPTGQVVERGSNANGQYVRFADGTQICTRNIAYASAAFGISAGALFERARETAQPFPAAFSTLPEVSFQCVGDGTQGCLSAASGTHSLTSWPVHVLLSTSSAAQTISILQTAIGRWF